MADIGLIRKRLLAEIDAARRTSADRRARAQTVTRAYEAFLADVATPVFRQMANVLKAEGIPYDIETPGNGVRLVASRNRDDVLALELDTSTDPPQPILIGTRTRGSRPVRTERAVKEGAAIETITEDDLIERLFEELRARLE